MIFYPNQSYEFRAATPSSTIMGTMSDAKSPRVYKNPYPGNNSKSQGKISALLARNNESVGYEHLSDFLKG